MEVIVDPTIRITSASASLPLSVDNNTADPLRVELTLRSERLWVDAFDDGETTTLFLAPGVNTYSFDTEARGSGRYTIDVELRSPDGALLLAAAAVTVEPTAPSFLAVTLIATALGVLAIWWLRDRARRRTSAALT